MAWSLSTSYIKGAQLGSFYIRVGKLVVVAAATSTASAGFAAGAGYAFAGFLIGAC
jgi:hypothetical protein